MPWSMSQTLQALARAAHVPGGCGSTIMRGCCGPRSRSGTVLVPPEPGLFAGEMELAGSKRTTTGASRRSLLKTYRVATPVPRLKLARRGD
jgi:hypothetical protein